MPELPEVETIRRILRDGTEKIPSILGWVVQRGEVFWDRTLVTPSIAELYTHLPGLIVREIGRRGKYLVFNLNDKVLLIHLRMSGDLWIEADNAPIMPHYRMIIWFENGFRLVLNDPRKFGRAWLVADPQEVLRDLGPEPLENNFTVQVLFEQLRNVRRQLKPLLLDQSFIAGLGNIYVDEALHMAGLHPLALSNRVDRLQAERLWASIRSVLHEAILRNGSSIDWVYRGGDFQNHFRVYQRTGEPCPVCGTQVERLVVGQRGTHYCPHCQGMSD